MKNKKVFIKDCLTEVSSIEVPLRFCYVVGEFGLKLTWSFVKFLDTFNISFFVTYPSRFLSNTLNANSALASVSSPTPLLRRSVAEGPPTNSSLLIFLKMEVKIFNFC